MKKIALLMLVMIITILHPQSKAVQKNVQETMPVTIEKANTQVDQLPEAGIKFPCYIIYI